VRSRQLAAPRCASASIPVRASDPSRLSVCNTTGHIRAAFANLPPDATRAAAVALKAGLRQLVNEGSAVLQQHDAADKTSKHWSQH